MQHGRSLRALGIDDGPFERGSRRPVLVVGAIYSASAFEGLLSTRVQPDGYNATDRLIGMITGSKFHSQLHVVMLDGITLGGFNVVDLPTLAEETGVPCIAVVRRRPDLQAVRRAVSRLPQPRRRAALFDRAGEVHRAGALWFQAAGLRAELGREVIASSVLQGNMPECLRAAHLIARGIEWGESGRRA
jgi:hypothetical protein